MILRRLTQHVNDQNWFAVVLDFIIVVAGILIAFQITNWSAARQDNLIYQQARTRVIEEAEVNFTQAQIFIARANDYQRAAESIIRDFESCETEPESEGRLMNAMQTLRFILTVAVRDDAIRLMLTSDAFLDNISPEDRALLSLYAQRVNTVAENQRFSERFQISRGVVQDNPIFGRTLDADSGDGLIGLVLNVSYEEACGDNALNTLLYDRVEHATYHRLQAERLVAAAREVLVALGQIPPEGIEPERSP